jgi:hypothetical protein
MISHALPAVFSRRCVTSYDYWIETLARYHGYDQLIVQRFDKCFMVILKGIPNLIEGQKEYTDEFWSIARSVS